MTKGFEETDYLVVGGSSGIGRAIASRLLAEGAGVHIWSRSKPDDLVDAGARWIEIDVTEEIDEGTASLPDVLSGVVYAPGSINLGAFHRLSPDVYIDDFNLNVVGAVRVLKIAIPKLTAAKSSSVVFFGTVAATVGMQFHASVASSKGALVGLSKSIAAEYAAKGVRSNVIAPALTDTPLASRLLNNDKKREAAAARHPLGRYGEPSDIADAAIFLLSPENSWITGQVLGVDGGMGAISGL